MTTSDLPYEPFDYLNPLHRAIHKCVAARQLGNFTRVYGGADGTTGYVQPVKNDGFSKYFWEVRDGYVYCAGSREPVATS